MDGKLNTLRLMFPNTTMDQAIVALKTNNWDLDQTIDYLLATTEAEEIAKTEDVVVQPPPPPTSRPTVAARMAPIVPPIQPRPIVSPRTTSDGKIVEQINLVPKNATLHIPKPALSPRSSSTRVPSPDISDDENEKILKEFLLLERQQQRQQLVPNPEPTLGATPVNVEVVELPKPSTAQKVSERDLESAQRDISLLKSISNTLRELENEVKNINNEIFDNKEGKEVEKEIKEEIEEEEEERERELDENNNNNDDEREPLFGNRLPNIPSLPSIDLDQAVEQLETIFNSSLEKTEKMLKSLKEEIESWKIKDKAKTITSSIRLELSEMLESIASFISPVPSAAQYEEREIEREEKRAELEKKLQELKEYNARLEEERRIAIEKIEKRNQLEQELPPPPPVPSSTNSLPPPILPSQLPPPPAPNAPAGFYYYYDPSNPNIYYYHPLSQTQQQQQQK